MKVIEQSAISQSLIETRKNNLKSFIDEKFNGNNTAFAKAVEKNVNQINLFLTENEKFFRPMGERVARSMEMILGLKEGYFDQPSGQGSVANLSIFKVRYQDDKGECNSHGVFSFPHNVFKDISPQCFNEKECCYLKYVSKRDGWILVNSELLTIKKNAKTFLIRFKKTAEQFVVKLSLHDSDNKFIIKSDNEQWSITSTKFFKTYDIIGQVFGSFRFHKA